VEFFGRYRLREITPFLVESFKAKRRKAPVIYKKKTATGVYEYSEKPRSAAAVNRELQLLSRIFSLADVENPCCKVDLLKGEKKRKRYLLPEERERLIQALAMPGREWLARIILVGLYTGLRRNELLGLRAEHIDFANNLIYVAGVKSELDAGTKTEEDRDVYMNPRVKAIVCDQMTLAKANGWEYIFTNPRTGTRYKDIKNGFKSILREAGIENFWFHDLRRSFATRAGSDPSVAIPALAATLGHKNWQTTMRYTHATEDAKRRVVEAQ
jgi:integrase